MYLCISPIHFRSSEHIYMKLGMYIMAPEPISAAYFITHFHRSECLYLYPPVVARQCLGKIYRGDEYTRNNKKIVGSLGFHLVPVV
jgi:hypothetical protein